MKYINLDDFLNRCGEWFEDYHYRHPAWGSLHVILADGNLEKHQIEYCIEFADERDDWEGYILGHLLNLLSKEQLTILYKEGLI